MPSNGCFMVKDRSFADIDPFKVLESIQSMVFGLLWTIVVVLVVIIIIVVLLKVLFAVFAIGPVAFEQYEIEAITTYAQIPQILR